MISLTGIIAKTEINGENYIGGERRAGWINDASAFGTT